MKICPKALKFCQTSFKILPTSKNCHRLNLCCQSGEISPNLVTMFNVTIIVWQHLFIFEHNGRSCLSHNLCLIASSGYLLHGFCSVTRFGKIMPLWVNFKSLWQYFEGLFRIWNFFDHTVAFVFNYWASFHCCRLPNNFWSHWWGIANKIVQDYVMITAGKRWIQSKWPS